MKKKQGKIKVLQVFYICMNKVKRDRIVYIPRCSVMTEESLILKEFEEHPELKFSKILYYVNKYI